MSEGKCRDCARFRDKNCGGCWYHELFGSGKPCEQTPELLGEEYGGE